MKKVIVVFDGAHYSKGVLSFVSQLNKIKPISLTGVFLSAFDFTSIIDNPVIMGFEGRPNLMGETLAYSNKEMEANIINFEQYCIKNGITFAVHNEVGGSVFQALIKETRFGDLMILSNDLFYSNIGEQLNDYMKEVLQSSECAVILIPEKFTFPNLLVLCYDGSPSSVFAIKQFSFILSELCNKETVLLCANPESREMPDMGYIEDLVVRHFPNLSMKVLEKESDKHFTAWINRQSSPIIIAGAFSRSGFYQLVHKSFISEIIKENNFPVFIAHK